MWWIDPRQLDEHESPSHLVRSVSELSPVHIAWCAGAERLPPGPPKPPAEVARSDAHFADQFRPGQRSCTGALGQVDSVEGPP